jgi:hypothetical protein
VDPAITGFGIEIAACIDDQSFLPQPKESNQAPTAEFEPILTF